MSFDGRSQKSSEDAFEIPPNLVEWRQRLFAVEDAIVMTEEEWNTYWPYCDNFWSHRSTQKAKNRPTQTLYFDCRLKGRPSGAPQNQDPGKKKRKRSARGRDLCDMKIKVTISGELKKTFIVERVRKDASTHGSGSRKASIDLDFAIPAVDLAGPIPAALQNPGASSMEPFPIQYSSFGPFATGHMTATFDNFDFSSLPIPPAAQSLMQQPNFVLPMSETADNMSVSEYGVPGLLGECHRHTLEESDKIKKPSAERNRINREKEKMKLQQQKGYHKKATGRALETVKRHSKDDELKLFGSCFCPFVQRVWIALEAKGLNYQYIEIDPYAKPAQLLEINPRGLVPALKHGQWGCYESNVLLEYLEDVDNGKTSLMPREPQLKAHSRLWIDHINRNIVPGFYRYLQAQEQEKQLEFAEELKNEVSKIVEAADPSGPLFTGNTLGLVDVSIAPWFIRFSRVLHPYRGWPLADPNSRLGRWISALESHPAVGNTISDDGLYFDSYERYAENRPDTSQVAKAVNAGRGLP